MKTNVFDIVLYIDGRHLVVKNHVETILSNTADFFEDAIAGNPVAKSDFTELLNNNQNPNVVRILQDMPGYEVVIAVRSSQA
jgi:hypothetical protein